MGSKMNSFEDKIKLPVTETISRFYQPQSNRKAIRILTVAVYVLCVSLAAIMLSLYYIFIWDPTIKTFVPGKSSTNCEKFIIPEQIAIRLINSTEISADKFYKNILEHYQHTHKHRINKSPSTIKDVPIVKSGPRLRSTSKKTHTPSTETTVRIPSYSDLFKYLHKKISEDDEDYTDDIDILESSGQYPILKQ